MAILKSDDYFLSEELNEGSGFWIRAKSLIASVRSPFQDIELFDTTTYGKALRIDKYWMTSEKDEFYYHENMVHVGAISHQSPQSVLIIGGGDGGAAEAYLKYKSVKNLLMVEIDKCVVDFCKQHLFEIHKGVFDDPRMQVLYGDGKAFVEKTQNKFDLMMLDLTDPFGPAETLYRVEFLKECQRILGDQGVLSLHLGSPVSKPRVFHRLVSSLKEVFKIVRPFLVFVPTYGTWWGMATASNETDPLNLSTNEVESRIKDRGINDLKFYNGLTHKAVFAMPNYVKDILEQKPDPLTRLNPMHEDGLDPQQHLKISVSLE